jgi:hypothetical protein
MLAGPLFYSGPGPLVNPPRDHIAQAKALFDEGPKMGTAASRGHMTVTDRAPTAVEPLADGGQPALLSPSYGRLTVAATLLFILLSVALFFGARSTDLRAYVVVGMVAFLVVGRIFGLQGRGEWVRAVVAFAVALVVSYIIGAIIFNQLWIASQIGP